MLRSFNLLELSLDFPLFIYAPASGKISLPMAESWAVMEGKYKEGRVLDSLLSRRGPQV